MSCSPDTDRHPANRCSVTDHLAAFAFWEQCLKFMEPETVARGRDSLERTLERQVNCAPADSSFWLYLDSVSAWHVASRPDSRELARAAGYLERMRGMLPAYNP